MQFLPCARFCQNSSRFLACGNCPAMPITAMGWSEDPTGSPDDAGATLLRRDIRWVRHDFNFWFATFAILDFGPCGCGPCDNAFFSPGANLAASSCRDSVPCFSASSLTWRLSWLSVEWL